MIESILRKHTSRPIDEHHDNLVDATTESFDDFGAFGWLRGVKERSIMLELRKKDGNVQAVGYAWLERATFDPSVGITLHIVGKTIRITGRNLNAEIRPLVRLFQGITRHCVPWIQEADESAVMTAGKVSTIIERIEW